MTRREVEVAGWLGERELEPRRSRGVPGFRVTYRAVRVLEAVAAAPGASDREIADGAGVTEEGQISPLLAQLEGHGLIENTDRGEPNAWRLTVRGEEVWAAVEGRGGEAGVGDTQTS
jgi:hypothetical protein